MEKLEKLNSNEKRFTSVYLVEEINKFREIEGSKSILLHKNFLAKIEKEFEEEITGLKIQLSEYKDKSGKMNKMCELNYEQSLQMLMSESRTVRKGVIEVLKAQQKKIEELSVQAETPQQLMARALMVAQETLEQKDKLLEAQAPKVESFDRFLDAEGSFTLRDTAQKLSFSPNKFTERLRHDKVVYRLGENNNHPRSEYVNKGYFTVRTVATPHGKAVTQTRVTPKGISWLDKKYPINLDITDYQKRTIREF